MDRIKEFKIEERYLDHNGNMYRFTYSYNGRGHSNYTIDEDSGFGLFHETTLSSRMNASVHFVESKEVINETACIRLPVNGTKDFKGSCYNDYKTQIDDVNHCNIWVTYQYQDRSNHNQNDFIEGVVWVELREPIDDVRMIPFFIFNGGGVAIHPAYHKYFLRGFTKSERHHITGFIYKYGVHILNDAYWINERKHRDIEDADIEWAQQRAIYFKDSEVPKRIDMGPSKTLKGTSYEYVIDNYKEWLKRTKR